METAIRQENEKLLEALEKLQDKIEKQIQKINENSDALICHTDEIWYRYDKIQNQQKKHKKFGGYIFNQLLKAMLYFAK